MGFGDWLKGLFGGGSKGGGTPSCIACEATDLVELAPNAYRCAMCGYEGGDGYAAFLADKERVELRKLDTAALKAKVVADLKNARLTLLAAIGGKMSDSTGGWDFSIDIDGGGYGLGAANEEERERIRNEREAGIAKACAEAVVLTPTFDVLAEQGIDVAEHQQRLRVLELAQGSPDLESLKKFIANAGKMIEA